MSTFDYNRPALQILLDLIYISNGIRFDDDEVTVGVPQALDQRPDLDWDPNTFIPVSVPDTADARYQGATGMMYRRMYLSEVPLSDPPPLPVPLPPLPFKTSDILGVLNVYYGIQLTVDDIIDQEYTIIDQPILLVFAPGSLVWRGDALLTDTLFRPMIPFPLLSGFVEYDPLLPNSQLDGFGDPGAP